MIDAMISHLCQRALSIFLFSKFCSSANDTADVPVKINVKKSRMGPRISQKL